MSVATMTRRQKRTQMKQVPTKTTLAVATWLLTCCAAVAVVSFRSRTTAEAFGIVVPRQRYRGTFATTTTSKRRATSASSSSSSRLRLFFDDFLSEEQQATRDFGGGIDDRASSFSSSNADNDLDCPVAAAAPNSDSDRMHEQLRKRRRDLEDGIGRRYVVRIPKNENYKREGGRFGSVLNVHKEPADPTYSENVVGTLTDGDVVTSVGPPRGAWIRHDKGGWSICAYGGFAWLEALQE